MTDLEREAVRLETETPFSREQWLSALLRLDGEVERDGLLRAIRDAVAVLGINPDTVAAELLGALAEFRKHEQAVRRIVTAEGIREDELQALTEGITRLAAGDGTTSVSQA